MSVKPILVVYHCLFQLGNELLPSAIAIVNEQVGMLNGSGLMNAAQEIIVGVNGGEEDRLFTDCLFPEKAQIIFHGAQCRNECRTIVAMEHWLTTHPDWYVLYMHTKGAAHPCDLNDRWRRCMCRTCIIRWRECVSALEQGYEAAGVHWAPSMGVHMDQFYFAGTFFFATSNFLRTLPSICERDRIKESGIDSVESRYEAEVWIGNGPRLPRVKDMDRGHELMRCP